MKLTPGSAGPLLVAVVWAIGLAHTTMAQNVTVVNMIPKSASNETNQDSEPNLAVNPADVSQMAASAFTPNTSGILRVAPIYLSANGGILWTLAPIVPSGPGYQQEGTIDITLRFGGTSGLLYVTFLERHGFASIASYVVRGNPFATPGMLLTPIQTVMGSIDQPYVEATTVLAGPGTGSDRVYVGQNDLGVSLYRGNGKTASLNQSLDAASVPPAGFSSPPIFIESRTTCAQDNPSIRPAIHANGTVYAAFVLLTACDFSTNNPPPSIANVVVVRDDHWGAGGTPYSDLMGPDSKPGVAVVSSVADLVQTSCVGSGGPGCMGTERIGSALSIAVDPNNASNVWVAWGDGADASHFTLHVRQSADKGVTWNSDLRTVAVATNPALAITSQGVVGFLYQKFVDPGTCSRPQGDNATSCWETHLETSSTGSPWSDRVLANVPDGPAQFDPSIGDYTHLLAVGKNLYGVFSASNYPDLANFPQGNPGYQRNVDFGAHRLLDINSNTEVGISVDPFFFSVTPDPCQGLLDDIDLLKQRMAILAELANDTTIGPAAHHVIGQESAMLYRLLLHDEALLKQCQLQHP
jgi:hypothetical protein